MRVLIQNCKTKLFLKKDRGWTEKMEEALSFDSGTSAITFYQQMCIPDVQLVYDTGDPSLNFTSPVSASCR
jgi:hypothetical protein